MQALEFDVREALDLYGPRRAIRDMATALDFPRSAGQELAIVVSELVSNILKYGVRGSLRFEVVNSQQHGAGIQVVARDEGPPFYDLELALRDGFDDRGPIDPGTLLKRGGLGTGMGAIVRMTDSFQVEPSVTGKEIRVVRYRQRPKGRAPAR